MDFVDTLFSFIPLLMIVLFFVRIASAARKKRPKPLNTIEPAAKEAADQKDQKKPSSALKKKAAAAAADATASKADSPSHSVKSKIFTEATEDFAALLERLSGGKIKTPAAADYSAAQPPAEAAPPQQEYRPKTEGLNSLAESRKANPAAAGREKSALSRMNSLPELKKAVVWAEILGKPKGLD